MKATPFEWEDPGNLPPREKPPFPILHSKEEVEVLGEGLTPPLIWQGRQWDVTGFGVEARDGTYTIERKRLFEETNGHGWPEQLVEKSWADIEDFMTALYVARGYYGRQD